MSDLDKKEVLRHFSREFLDGEVKRVESAKQGEKLFEMDSWESPMLINYVLESAKIGFHVESSDGTIQYIKGVPSEN